jgi:hypothetical protein
MSTKAEECRLLHTRCGACGCAIHQDGGCGCEDNRHHPVGDVERDLVTRLRRLLARGADPAADPKTDIVDTSDPFAIVVSHVRIVAETFLEDFFGERCSEQEENCECCRRWKWLDLLTANPDEDTPSEKEKRS